MVQKSNQKIIYCFDIDGVICTNTNGRYKAASPLYNNIKKINSLYMKGNTIILHTARGSTTGIDWKKETKKQLKCWRVKYHQLLFNKVNADVFVDDKGVHPNEFFKK